MRPSPAHDALVAHTGASTKSIGDWLAPRIWQQGARHDLDAMVRRATGEPLSDDALREPLEQRHDRSN